MEKENREKYLTPKGPSTVIEHSQRKIRLLIEFLVHNVPDDELWSEDAKTGFYHVLRDIEDDLEWAREHLQKERIIHGEELLKSIEAARQAGKI